MLGSIRGTLQTVPAELTAELGITHTGLVQAEQQVRLEKKSHGTHSGTSREEEAVHDGYKTEEGVGMCSDIITHPALSGVPMKHCLQGGGN